MRLAFVLALALIASRAHAAPTGADLTIYVLTFGPGDHPFFKFGHNALWIRDNAEKTDKVYNWGTFYFDSPLLIPQFLKGMLRYWLSVDPLGATLGIYRYEHRTVDVQELDLTDEQKLAVLNDVETNAKPENKYYRYDYYMDNCTTRVRDVVDRALGGALHDVSHDPASMTFRQHTRRLTDDLLWEYLGLDIIMADFIDKPIDFWDEMFVPIKLYEGLQRVKIKREGVALPLVRSQRQLVAAPNRPLPPAAPPRWHHWFFLAGSLCAGLFMVAGKRHASSRPARIGLGVGLRVAGIFGVLGCIFIMMWAVTDHRVAHHNENIMQCAPFAIALLWVARGVSKRNQARITLATRISALAFLLAVIGLMAKVLPMADQTNLEFICFFIPFWLGLTVALRYAK